MQRGIHLLNKSNMPIIGKLMYICRIYLKEFNLQKNYLQKMALFLFGLMYILVFISG
jgi:hypothetical protein